MEPDFSGWATKASVKCSDGRTIMPGAFKHQDKMQVPLVWQHGHTDPENVLGHVILHAKDDGVRCEAFFNSSKKAKHAKELVQHKDINALSIWANGLVERAKSVLHGAIREVSLVLSGANPGALIDNVIIRHDDGGESEAEDEAIIYTGLVLEHSGTTTEEDDETVVEHADGDRTVQDVYDSMTEEQQQVLHYMVGEALESASVGQSGLKIDKDDSETMSGIIESMNDEQKQVLHYMVGEALESSNIGNGNNDDPKNPKKGDETVKHNVFEDDKETSPPEKALSHDALVEISKMAQRGGSLKAAVEDYGLKHGIDNIETLFPDAKAIQDIPELFARRTEWVGKLLDGVRKTPFSRIKTRFADITVQEARAKGYVKGELKKEEFFALAGRETTPQTVYKKQKLDRDDMVDITDFDVVAWLKGEMRLMLDEEMARAILVGDGRDVTDEDKIKEDKIRPVASDHELYTTTVTVNIGDANSSMQEVIDAITTNRFQLRGSGLPVAWMAESYIARFLLLRDSLGRDLYKDLSEVATKLRVSNIESVEVLEEYPDIVAILFNPADYTVGATAGGQVNFFDDFDIDYNQHKYLIEARFCGALTKLKSALVVRRSGDADVLVAPADPAFDGTNVTIVNTPGVTYRNADTDVVMTASGSPYPVAPDTTLNVHAEPNAGYYIATSADDDWSFTNPG